MSKVKKGYALVPTSTGGVKYIFFKCTHFEENSIWMIEYFFPIHIEVSYKVDNTDNMFCFQGIRNYQKDPSKKSFCSSDRSILTAYAITQTSIHDDLCSSISIIAMKKAQQYITILE